MTPASAPCMLPTFHQLFVQDLTTFPVLTTSPSLSFVSSQMELSQLCSSNSSAGYPAALLRRDPFEEKVAVLTNFFGTRLLLRRYRIGKRDPSSALPPAVAECEAAFHTLATTLVKLASDNVPLDAVVWAERCSDFSEHWISCCHWISPRKLREFCSENLNAKWINVEEVPLAKEQPPVDLKWYKSLEGSDPPTKCMCPLCHVNCNSRVQYDAHCKGRHHKILAREYARKTGCGVDIEPIPIPVKSEEKAEESLGHSINPEGALCDDDDDDDNNSPPLLEDGGSDDEGLLDFGIKRSDFGMEAMVSNICQY